MKSYNGKYIVQVRYKVPKSKNKWEFMDKWAELEDKIGKALGIPMVCGARQDCGGVNYKTRNAYME